LLARAHGLHLERAARGTRRHRRPAEVNTSVPSAAAPGGTGAPGHGPGKDKHCARGAGGPAGQHTRARTPASAQETHMTRPASPGALFRQALKDESPLQIIGAINAHHALLAQRAGYRTIYLSGGGVAAGSLGLPDLGINTLDDVLIDVRRITDVCDLPLLVDIDTGFGPSAFNIARTIKSLIKFGAAGCHIEDQVGAKRCGHRPGKEIVGTDE